MSLDLMSLKLPDHWATVLLYGDVDGLSDEEERCIDEFELHMLNTYGSCRCVEVLDDSEFMNYHDGLDFGELAGNASTFIFDVTK